MLDTTEASPIVGVSRRDFLKYCSWLAALIGLDVVTGTPQVAEALEQATKLPIVVWSQFQECTGCTVALLQNTSPTPGQLILQQISLAYLETAMATAGAYNAKGENYTELNFNEAFKQRAVWICEGSVATKIPYAMSVAGKTSMDIVKETFPKAKATIAIGSCACFGNIQAAKPDPTGAMGIRDYLRQKGGVPDAAVINMARCPANAEDLVAVITYVLVMGKVPPLDDQGRPLFLYGQTIHDNCERRGHFDAGEFVEVFGDANSAKGYCLYKVGCKGPVTYAPCAVTRWNGRVSWCNASGGPCTGCAENNFWDTLTPFGQQVPGFSFPAMAGVSPATVGWVLGGATAVGLGAHLIGQVATGRAFRGGPTVGEPNQTGAAINAEAAKKTDAKGGDM